MIKEALVTCGPTFTTARMMDDYVTKIYTQPTTRGPFATAEAGDVCRHRLTHGVAPARTGAARPRPPARRPSSTPGTAFHAPSRSPSGSETMTRDSSESSARRAMSGCSAQSWSSRVE